MGDNAQPASCSPQPIGERSRRRFFGAGFLQKPGTRKDGNTTLGCGSPSVFVFSFAVAGGCESQSGLHSLPAAAGGTVSNSGTDLSGGSLCAVFWLSAAFPNVCASGGIHRRAPGAVRA